MSLRILLLAPHPFYAARGTPMAERSMIRALCDVGHRIDVLTYHEGEDPDIPGSRIFRIPPIPGVYDVPPGLSWKKMVCDLALATSFLLRIRKVDYDVVHAVEESVFLARIGQYVTKTPYVYDMDSSLPHEVLRAVPWLSPLGAFLDAIERWGIRGSDGVLAMCASLADHAREQGAPGPVGVAEDATLLTRPPESERIPEDLALIASHPVVMYVGNLASYQGVELLADAFARLTERRPDVRLVVIGGGEDRIGDLRERARRKGCGEQTHLLGPRSPDRLGAYFAGADVLVSPRLHGDNTPMKIYSYLDSGRPVVATRIRAHTQVVDEDIAALVEPDPQTMAETLVDLLADPERRRALATRARRKVRREYTPEAQRSKILAFYRRLECALGIYTASPSPPDVIHRPFCGPPAVSSASDWPREE
mgnify:CR=1 FL=1